MTEELSSEFAALTTAAAAPPRTDEEWRGVANDLVRFYDAHLGDLKTFRDFMPHLQQAKKNAETITQTGDTLEASNNIADAPAFLNAIHTYENEELAAKGSYLSKAQRALTRVFAAGKEHRKLKKQFTKASKRGRK